MNTVWLSLGTNIGDRSCFLQLAIENIQQKIGNVSKRSSVYESEPWGFTADQPFLNQVIKVETTLLPNPLLLKLQAIERGLGRKRNSGVYESRTIDIDILFYNNLKINNPDLTIPHPLLHQRSFIMIPLAEIAGDFIHPVFYKSLDALAKTCKDNKSVEVYIQSQTTIVQKNEI